MKDYLIIERDALPDYFSKVLEARRLLESGAYQQVSDAVNAVGISRSTFYKYRDKILEPEQLNLGHLATVMLTLTNRAGMLSQVLSAVSRQNANVLTITQSLPVHGRATIMMTLDLKQLTGSVDALTDALRAIQGAEKVRLLAIE